MFPQGGNAHERRWKVSLSDRDDDPEWDDFVYRLDEPHHEQTSLWGRVRGQFGWKAFRVVIRNGGGIVAGAQVLQRRVGPMFSVGYLPRGPLVADPTVANVLLEELRRVCRARGILYLALSLPYNAHAIVPAMQQIGIGVRPARLPPAIWTKATVVLDLDREEEALLADMSASKRKQVRRGLRAPMVVREAGRTELGTFEDLMLALCRRRGVVANVPPGGFLELLWDTFAPRGRLRLLVAEYNGRPICAQLLMLDGSWARAWRIGWSGDAEEFCPNDLLYWESIRWAKRNGYKKLDLFGIDIEDAQALVHGRDRRLPFKCPITYFKTGFGGRILLLPGEFCDFPHPAVRMLYRFGGRAILESEWMGRVLDWLHRRTNARQGPLNPSAQAGGEP